MLTAEEATARLREALLEHALQFPAGVPKSWRAQLPEPELDPLRGWLFFAWNRRRQGPSHNYEASVVRLDDGRVFSVYGAVANLFFARDDTGLPRSNERHVGVGPGRYQMFENGIILWEGPADQPYYVPVPPRDRDGRSCQLVIAFYDLRGSTVLTNDPARASDIQNLLAELESSLQWALSHTNLRDSALPGPEHYRDPYIKGTGDGAMLAVEWSGEPERVSDFLDLCVTFMDLAEHRLSHGLSLGCGIDCGPATQVFAFGRRDYLGSTINNAFKLQEGRKGIWVSANVHRQVELANPTLALSLKASEHGYRYEPGRRLD
jgi:class 3 adenylate cyclase